MSSAESVIEVVFVVRFDHEKGNEVEWFFPPNAAVMTRTDPFYEAFLRPACDRN
jgi:hypothetical protein